MDTENYESWNMQTPALVRGMPNSDYHAHAAYSASGLKLIERSPAHFAHAASREPSRAMVIGTAIHCALLEPERFEAEYVCSGSPDRRASEYKQAVKAKGTDELVLTQPEWDKVAGMQAETYANPESRDLLETPGECELSVFAVDEATGLPVKCRTDKLAHYYRGHVIVDVKKCQDARPEEFSKSVARYGYDMAAAHYIDTFTQATGHAPADYFLIAVEEEPPHGVKVYRLPAEWIDYGRQRRNAALETAAECDSSGVWPAYDQQIDVLMPPGWIAHQINEQVAEEIY